MLKKQVMELSELNGPSGFEKDVTSYIVEELKRVNITDYHFDKLGNLYVRLEGTDPKAPVILLDAHTDEPGFMVKYIDDNGFLFLIQTGLFTHNILLGQRVRILTKNGPIKGAFGVKPYHLSSSDGRSLEPNLDDMWVDIGASSSADAIKLGIKPGQAAVFDEPCIELANNMIMGKGFDNRAACAVLMETIRRLVSERPESTVYFTFSVQEELILRGAHTIFNGIRKFFGKIPDFCITYDITMAGDTPQVKKQKAPIQLGKGAGIKIIDKSIIMADYVHIVPENVIEYFEKLCKENDIPYQLDLMLGCTNAVRYAIEDIGVITGGISIPCRYSHSPVEVVSVDDMQSAMELTLNAIKNIDQLDLEL